MRLLAIIQAMIIFIALWFTTSCREPITYINDIEYIYEVCDTINTKHNFPDVGDITYTVRCTDQFGNERTFLIVERP